MKSAGRLTVTKKLTEHELDKEMS